MGHAKISLWPGKTSHARSDRSEGAQLGDGGLVAGLLLKGGESEAGMREKSPVYFVLLIALALALPACDNGSPTEPTEPCTYTLSPPSLSFGASGGSGSVNVTSASHCTWT